MLFFNFRLKEQRDLLELEHQQECERLETNNQKLKLELDTLQLEVTDKQVLFLIEVVLGLFFSAEHVLVWTTQLCCRCCLGSVKHSFTKPYHVKISSKTQGLKLILSSKVMLTLFVSTQ